MSCIRASVPVQDGCSLFPVKMGEKINVLDTGMYFFICFLYTLLSGACLCCINTEIQHIHMLCIFLYVPIYMPLLPCLNTLHDRNRGGMLMGWSISELFCILYTNSQGIL